jgi:prepilin-type N-terminal cleavage/methylation domain-containing protein
MRSSFHIVRASFTLIEMIVVLVIMSVMVAIAAPSLGRFHQNLKLSSCVRDFRTFAESARSQAVFRHSPCRLVIQPGWREIDFETRRIPVIGSPKEAVDYIKKVEAPPSADGADDAFVPLEGSFSRIVVPDGVEINYISVGGQEKSPFQRIILLFSPDLRMEETDISFRNTLKEYQGLRLEAGSGLLRDLQVVK